MSTYRYRLVCEVYEDDKLIRRMEESRDKLDNDHTDGEKTMGLLLAFVPAWFEQNTIGGFGLMTLANMLKFLPSGDRDVDMLKTIGMAFDEWGTAHNFHTCVSVVVDQERLKCGAVECEHGDH